MDKQGEFGRRNMMILILLAAFTLLSTAEIAVHKDAIQLIKSRKLLAVASDDGCGKPSLSTPKVVTCYNGYHAQSFKSTCKSYPSLPRNIKHSFSFDRKSKDLSVTISWDEPEYGLNTLWGYDVLLSGQPSVNEQCYEINGKEPSDRTFTFNNTKFGKSYLFIVTSLPRLDGKMRNSINKTLKSPDKCEVYKKLKLDLPFSCLSVQNFRIEQKCNQSGVALLSWDKPLVDFDQFFMEIRCSDSAYSNFVELDINKNATSQWIQTLKCGRSYIVQIFLFKFKNNEFSMQQSVTLQCDGKTTETLENLVNLERKRSDVQVKVIIYLLPISMAILIAIGIALFLWHRKRKKMLASTGNAVRLRSGISSTCRSEVVNNNSDLNKTEVFSLLEEEKPANVMILHSCGCKVVEEFVLLLANFLHSCGILVHLDLLESEKLAGLGAAVYLEKTEAESKYVILVCTADTESNKPLRFILNIIKNKIMEIGNGAKYIPVYIDSKSYVPSCLQGTSTRVPDDLEGIIQRILDIPRYELNSPSSKSPVKNELKLDKRLLENLQDAASNVSQIVHERCNSISCSKGTCRMEQNLADSFNDLLLD